MSNLIELVNPKQIDNFQFEVEMCKSQGRTLGNTISNDSPSVSPDALIIVCLIKLDDHIAFTEAYNS